jgi:hypothetical protein
MMLVPAGIKVHMAVGHRSQEGSGQARRAGGAGAGEGPVLRSHVRVPRQARRHDQGFVLGRERAQPTVRPRWLHNLPLPTILIGHVVRLGRASSRFLRSDVTLLRIISMIGSEKPTDCPASRASLIAVSSNGESPIRLAKAAASIASSTMRARTLLSERSFKTDASFRGYARTQWLVMLPDRLGDYWRHVVSSRERVGHIVL